VTERRRRVVVTGGAGFLGSHLCDRLLQRGDEVVAIDNLATGRLANVEHLFGTDGFTFVRHDVSLYVWVPGPVDAVLHFASPASPKDYLDLPIQTLKVGSLGTHNTLGLAKDKRARYLLASTSEVYGDPQVHPQPEGYWGHVNPVGPRGVYDEAKRFAEAMVMAYHRAHGVDTRIARIFNSVLADEQVLYDNGRELRREPAGRLAERLAGRVDLTGFSVPSFDSQGRIIPSEATAFVEHPPVGRCFQIATAYGRTIRVTGDHSLFVEGEDGQPEPRPVRELHVGDRVAIAGKVRVPVRDRPAVRMTEVWDWAGNDPWTLFVRAPGLGGVAWSRRREVFNIIAHGCRPESKVWRNVVWSQIRRMRDRDQIPLAVLRRLGIGIPQGSNVRRRGAGHAAELPETVELSDEMLWLLGLYVAEGCRHEALPKSSFVSISCDHDTLARATKILERELGLHVCRSKGGRDARSPAIFVHSRLLLLLLDRLGFDDGAKRIPGWVLGLPLSRLKWFLEGYRMGDGVHSGKKLVEGVRHELSTTSDELKDDLVVALARFGLVPSVGRYDTTLRHRTGDRRYPFWRLTLSRVAPWSPLEWDRGVRQVLNARRTGDLVWAKVKRIDEIEPTSMVYDFCVPSRENFWAGVGIMAHNTYGPRIRPADGRVVANFLVQALEGKPLTVYGDGSQTRSFCYVDDLVRGLLALLESDHVGPVNIGNPTEHTVRELAEVVLEVTGSSSSLVFEPLPVDDPTQRRPDISLARRLLGWEPEVSLRDGLARTARWLDEVAG
jgi:UDP-glucuronate decarboxylase